MAVPSSYDMREHPSFSHFRDQSRWSDREVELSALEGKELHESALAHIYSISHEVATNVWYASHLLVDRRKEEYPFFDSFRDILPRDDFGSVEDRFASELITGSRSADGDYLYILVLRHPEDPDYVIFPGSPSALITGKWKVMKLGRFVRKLNPELTDEAIRWIGSSSVDHIELKFATDADEVEEVYTSKRLSSCMGYGASHYNSYIHPVRIYGLMGDHIRIAYIEREEGKCHARTIVNTNTMTYGRIFGDCDRLSKILERAGFDGPGIPLADEFAPRIEDDDMYVMPYVDDGVIDTHLYVITTEDDDTFQFVTSNYDGDKAMHGCDATYGLIRVPESYCEYYEEIVEDHPDNLLSVRVADTVQAWCEQATREHAFRCAWSGTWFDNSTYESVLANGRRYERRLFESRVGGYCARSGMPHRNRELIRLEDGSRISLEEFNGATDVPMNNDYWELPSTICAYLHAAGRVSDNYDILPPLSEAA